MTKTQLDDFNFALYNLLVQLKNMKPDVALSVCSIKDKISEITIRLDHNNEELMKIVSDQVINYSK